MQEGFNLSLLLSISAFVQLGFKLSRKCLISSLTSFTLKQNGSASIVQIMFPGFQPAARKYMKWKVVCILKDEIEPS